MANDLVRDSSGSFYSQRTANMFKDRVVAIAEDHSAKLFWIFTVRLIASSASSFD
jgi:hypothetical protein